LHLWANLPGELTALSQTPSWMKVGKKGKGEGKKEGGEWEGKEYKWEKNRNKEREGRKGGRGWEEGGKSGKGGRSPILVSKSRRL